MAALAHTVYRRLTWLERPLAVADASAPPASPEHETRVLTAADAGMIAALRPDLGTHEIDRRLARGDRCVGAWQDGRLVSCIWVSRRVAPIAYLGIDLPLPADAAYLHDLWTEPGQRGRRIAPALTAAVRAALADEGVRVATATVLPENGAGLAHIRRGGYVQVATVGWIGAGPLRRPFLRRVRRTAPHDPAPP